MECERWQAGSAKLGPILPEDFRRKFGRLGSGCMGSGRFPTRLNRILLKSSRDPIKSCPNRLRSCVFKAFQLFSNEFNQTCHLHCLIVLDLIFQVYCNYRGELQVAGCNEFFGCNPFASLLWVRCACLGGFVERVRGPGSPPPQLKIPTSDAPANLWALSDPCLLCCVASFALLRLCHVCSSVLKPCLIRRQDCEPGGPEDRAPKKLLAKKFTITIGKLPLHSCNSSSKSGNSHYTLAIALTPFDCFGNDCPSKTTLLLTLAVLEFSDLQVQWFRRAG